MRFRRLLLASGIAIATACSTLRTSVDYDPSLDFSRYETFDFRAGTPARRSFTQKRIEDVIAEALRSKGLTRVREEKPDLRVYTHVVVDRQQRIGTTVWGYGWRWGGGIATTTVTEIPIGTLIVDLVDTDRREVVWRGRATDTIDSDSQVREQQLQKAVSKLFESFPARTVGG